MNLKKTWGKHVLTIVILGFFAFLAGGSTYDAQGKTIKPLRAAKKRRRVFIQSGRRIRTIVRILLPLLSVRAAVGKMPKTPPARSGKIRKREKRSVRAKNYCAPSENALK